MASTTEALEALRLAVAASLESAADGGSSLAAFALCQMLFEMGEPNDPTYSEIDLANDPHESRSSSINV